MKLPARIAGLGLTPAQTAAVTALFFLTLFGALALALALRWWNVTSAGRRPSER